MAGVLFALMTPEFPVLSRIGNLLIFLKRCRRCPGVGAIGSNREALPPANCECRARSRHEGAGGEDVFRDFFFSHPSQTRQCIGTKWWEWLTKFNEGTWKYPAEGGIAVSLFLFARASSSCIR